MLENFQKEMQQSQNNINVHINPDEDSYVCSCGSDQFIQSLNLVKVSSPIINVGPQIAPINPKFFCYFCKREFDPDNMKIKKDNIVKLD